MIYIITHKRVKLPKLDKYLPLQVGSSLHEHLDYLTDDTGDNISEKNPNYCELTGLYWIWKNTKDDYKGLVHYRRYFGKSDFSSSFEQIYSYDELKGFLQDHDLVTSYVANFKQNAHDEIMIHCCTEEIFGNLRASVAKCSPEYLSDFDKFFNQNKAVLFNMMFCRGDLFDEYCQWLFTILFNLEPQVDLSSLNAYQQRLYGFLSERLLNIWISHKELKVKHLPIVNTEMPMKEKITNYRRQITNQIFYTLKK